MFPFVCRTNTSPLISSRILGNFSFEPFSSDKYLHSTNAKSFDFWYLLVFYKMPKHAWVVWVVCGRAGPYNDVEMTPTRRDNTDKRVKVTDQGYGNARGHALPGKFGSLSLLESSRREGSVGLPYDSTSRILRHTIIVGYLVARMVLPSSPCPLLDPRSRFAGGPLRYRGASILVRQS